MSVCFALCTDFLDFDFLLSFLSVVTVAAAVVLLVDFTAGVAGVAGVAAEPVDGAAGVAFAAGVVPDGVVVGCAYAVTANAPTIKAVSSLLMLFSFGG